jgi:hypothetical protein
MNIENLYIKSTQIKNTSIIFQYKNLLNRLNIQPKYDKDNILLLDRAYLDRLNEKNVLSVYEKHEIKQHFRGE